MKSLENKSNNIYSNIAKILQESNDLFVDNLLNFRKDLEDHQFEIFYFLNLKYQYSNKWPQWLNIGEKKMTHFLFPRLHPIPGNCTKRERLGLYIKSCDEIVKLNSWAFLPLGRKKKWWHLFKNEHPRTTHIPALEREQAREELIEELIKINNSEDYWVQQGMNGNLSWLEVEKELIRIKEGRASFSEKDIKNNL